MRAMGREQKAESRKNTQEIREKLKAPRCPPECPKASPREPQDSPKQSQEEPKRVKKANPNRKTKKGPNQDDPKTVLDRPRADLPSSAAPPGLHLGGQDGTNTDPKTMAYPWDPFA